MGLELKVRDNGDHTCLVWLPTDLQPTPECRGYAIRRIHNGQEDYLHGKVGFSPSDKLDPASPWKFPIQGYLWWDYFVKPGDTVRYSVIPVTGPASSLKLDTALATPLTPEMKITGQCSAHMSAFFNKGIVAAEYVSAALAKEPKGSKIKDVVATPGDPLRNELSGLLRPQILSLLAQAKQNGEKIYAALYELNDPELIAGLVALGQNCNLVLANGAFKPPDNDENKDIRAQLKDKVHVFDRIVTGSHFAHNKFVVFCDSAGKPQTVLTGSTNWTTSGLCTQANNGLIIQDANVAAAYLDAWNRYRQAGNGYPPALAAANSAAKTYTVDGCSVTPWFVPTQHAQDLDYARKLINNAKQGILFLFFNPGTFQPDDQPEKWTLLQNILSRRHDQSNACYDPNLYVKGVVNQEIPNLTEDAAPAHSVDLYGGGSAPPAALTHDVLVPANIKQQFAAWNSEMLGASMVNVHSKVIVLDPFGENPVVMTGSHNLGYKASQENDDNLCIVEGSAALAAAYAVNIIAIFRNYRWNSAVTAHQNDPSFWHGPVDNDQWQAGYLTGDSLAEIRFWLGEAGLGRGQI